MSVAGSVGAVTTSSQGDPRSRPANLSASGCRL